MAGGASGRSVPGADASIVAPLIREVRYLSGAGAGRGVRGSSGSGVEDFEPDALVALALVLGLHDTDAADLVGRGDVRPAVRLFVQADDVDHADLADRFGDEGHLGPDQVLVLDRGRTGQELDRDRQAISFTKGCYLGQETIARLDARGQLQKKLCLIELTPSREIAIGATLYNGEKEVGHITSLARDPASGSVRALAILRRGNFAAGTQLTGNGFEAQVLP